MDIRAIIKRILRDYAEIKPAYGQVETETVFDDTPQKTSRIPALPSAQDIPWKNIATRRDERSILPLPVCRGPRARFRSERNLALILLI